MYFASVIYLHRPVPSGSVSVEAGRYVGVTAVGKEKKRLKQHLAAARSNKSAYHQLQWLRSLAEAPVVEVLEQCFPWNRDEREKYWIALFRDYGHQLTNATEGGDGFGPGAQHPCYGRPKSSECRQKLSAVHQGRAPSPKAIEKTREANIGKKLPDASSPYHGVTKSGSGYRADAYSKGLHIYLGRFIVEEDAARAVDAYVRANNLSPKLLNFP